MRNHSPTLGPPPRSRSPSPDAETAHICILHGSEHNCPTPRLDVCIHPKLGTPFSFSALPDTGATRSVISYDLAHTNGMTEDTSHRVSLKAANGQHMNCLGVTTFTCSRKGMFVVISAIISMDLQDFFVSWHDLVKLGIIAPTFPDTPAPIPSPRGASVAFVFVENVVRK